MIDVLGSGAKYLVFELSAQIKRLFKFLFNAFRSIDLSKFKSKNKSELNSSIEEVKPRELKLPKPNPAPPQKETKLQESNQSVPKTETPKNESVATSTVYKPKDLSLIHI